ncbi:MAG TPA: NAD-dependent epimerase/dehydratase family protein [Ignisphaera aggregans]|uniref:NAD-dependent epimerase/dehydratase family protein n=1 Tax=Ignisphaera aggregans TaxID=334771 RepID=A0A832YYN6_9CREN|nr:NAD-dependent epimerase/dehydratase family protein [Ignisphaera aggregans]
MTYSWALTWLIYMAKCVVITGGAGFIGSATLEVLLRERSRLGVEMIVVVDNLYSGRLENIEHMLHVEGVKFVNIDVSRASDVEKLLQLVKEFRNEVGILHLAAMVSVDEVYRFPSRAVEVNVVGTINIAEMGRRVDAQRIVYASSVAVYGEPKYLPIDEEHELKPVNLYGLTKLMGEEILWRYFEDYGISVIALRYFNVYGPRMRFGPYASVVHKFIEALLRGSVPTIYGDGEQTRDFVYVYDVAEANLRALESRYVGPVNIGSGVEISINRLYSIVCRAVGTCPEPRRAPPRKHDVRRSRASIERAKSVLGWMPRIGIEEGIALTVEWYRKSLAEKQR